MKFISLVFLFLILGCTSLAQVLPKGFIDSSHRIFLSSKLQKQIGDYQAFPVFWWNFLVRDISTEKDWSEIEKDCAHLKSLSNLVLKMECQPNLKDFIPIIHDWAQDLPLRTMRPTDSIMAKKLDGAMTYASLPMGDRSLLDVFRIDPLESWKVLKAQAESKVRLKLPRKNGFFFDKTTSRVVIPIQMAFSPTESKKTALFVKELKALDGNWFFVGPHGSHLQNEAQIIYDVHHVSQLGTILLLLFGIILFSLKKGRVFILVVPVTLAMIISAALTILVFGSIHGLTLSFGTAIVGLALDYGLQAAFNNSSSNLWRANIYGLLTTLVGLLVLMTSSMPLLRQMMFFASVGIVAAFILMYFLFHHWPGKFTVTPLNILPHPKPLKTFLAGILILSSLVAFFVMKPTMDMSRFDYQEAKTFEVTKWLFTSLDMRAPLFDVLEGSHVLVKATAEKSWADGHKIEIENLASYVPAKEIQSLNTDTWKTTQCQNFESHLSSTEKRFFEPFILEKVCEPTILDFASQNQGHRSYLAHLNSENHWLTLWLPKSDEEEKSVRTNYPGVISIREVVSEIPLTLARELKWMAPLSIFLAFCFLFFYYRNFINTVSALVPFLSGMGLVSLCIWIFKLDVSFISIIGLVMVFGFSIDYGIFATDLHRGLRDQIDKGVWTGLTLAVLTTCAGFLPLLFCKHPILLGLGQTLFFGAVGTFIGALWGIPGFFSLIKKETQE